MTIKNGSRNIVITLEQQFSSRVRRQFSVPFSMARVAANSLKFYFCFTVQNFSLKSLFESKKKADKIISRYLEYLSLLKSAENEKVENYSFRRILACLSTSKFNETRIPTHPNCFLFFFFDDCLR